MTKADGKISQLKTSMSKSEIHKKAGHIQNSGSSGKMRRSGGIYGWKDSQWPKLANLWDLLKLSKTGR